MVQINLKVLEWIIWDLLLPLFHLLRNEIGMQQETVIIKKKSKWPLSNNQKSRWWDVRFGFRQLKKKERKWYYTGEIIKILKIRNIEVCTIELFKAAF